MNNKQADESEESDIEDDIVEKIPKISNSTAIKMCEELTKYCKEKNIWSVEIESSFETIKSEASINCKKKS